MSHQNQSDSRVRPAATDRRRGEIAADGHDAAGQTDCRLAQGRRRPQPRTQGTYFYIFINCIYYIIMFSLFIIFKFLFKI